MMILNPQKIFTLWFFWKTGSTILKEWTTPDSRNTPSTTNLEREEIVDAPGNDGNASMPEQVKRPNPWRRRRRRRRKKNKKKKKKKKKMMMMVLLVYSLLIFV
jgi:hypothetical protein